MVDRDLALAVARDATPESLRDIMATMIDGAWMFASGGAVPYALSPADLRQLRKALETAMHVVKTSDIVARPEVLRQRQAAVSAAADKSLQAFLSSVTRGS